MSLSLSEEDMRILSTNAFELIFHIRINLSTENFDIILDTTASLEKKIRNIRSHYG